MTKTKFISSYTNIYILLILAISHKVTKTIFDKTKTIIPKTWSIGLTKKSLMTYHLPKISLVVFTVNSQMTKQ